LGYQFDTPQALENLNALAGTHLERVEDPDTLANYLARLQISELPKFRRHMMQRLIRMKCLDRFRVNQAFLVAIDGTGWLTFPKRHCEHCLTRTQDNVTTYYHPVLEAKLVTPDGLALSLETEFIENPEEAVTKQDCETKAFHRLVARLKKFFPQLTICLLLDGLYAQQPVLDRCAEYGWHYFITFKEGSMPARFEEYARLKALQPANRLQRESDDRTRQEFAWINGLPIGPQEVNVLECREGGANGDAKTFVWMTDFALDQHNAGSLAQRVGRQRWKIENQGFNIQKNHGFNLEHAYSEDELAAKNFYLLLQIAHMILQIMEHGSLLPDIARAFGSKRALSARLLEFLRNRVLPSDALDVAAAAAIQIRLRASGSG
jgi:hypothetical protein